MPNVMRVAVFRESPGGMRINDRAPGIVNLPELRLAGLGARMLLARDSAPV